MGDEPQFSDAAIWLGFGPAILTRPEGYDRRRIVLKHTLKETTWPAPIVAAIAKAYPFGRDHVVRQLLKPHKLDADFWRRLYPVLVRGGPIQRDALIDFVTLLTGPDIDHVKTRAHAIFMAWEEIAQQKDLTPRQRVAQSYLFDPALVWLGLGAQTPDGLHGDRRKQLTLRYATRDRKAGRTIAVAIAQAYGAARREAPVLMLLRPQTLDDDFWRKIYALMVQGGPIYLPDLVNFVSNITSDDRKVAEAEAVRQMTRWIRASHLLRKSRQEAVGG